MIKNASVDASFWIHTFNAGLIEQLPSYFQLFVAQDVVQEIEHVSPGLTLPPPAGQALQQWREKNLVTVVEISQSVNWFDPGENAAIALARENNYILLLDDQAPYHFVKTQGLKAITSADFTILLYADGILSYERALSLLSQSAIGTHLKRAAMIALSNLLRRKDT